VAGRTRMRAGRGGNAASTRHPSRGWLRCAKAQQSSLSGEERRTIAKEMKKMHTAILLVSISAFLAAGCGTSIGLANAPTLGGPQVGSRRPPDALSNGPESCERGPHVGQRRGPQCAEEGRIVFMNPPVTERPVPARPAVAIVGPWSPRIDSECWTAPGEPIVPPECCSGSSDICVP
jgi:hypothetical protein